MRDKGGAAGPPPPSPHAAPPPVHPNDGPAPSPDAPARFSNPVASPPSAARESPISREGHGLDEARILDLVHESIFTCDHEGRIASWNAASEALYGWTRDEAIGQVADELLATRDPRPLDAGRWEGELVRTARSGAEVVVDARRSVERGPDGAVARLIETARDVTERRRQEEAVRLSEYRYRNMFQAMAVGFWEVDFTGVGALLIPLRDQGVTDLRAHLQANPDLVRTAMDRSIVLDVNVKALELFGAEDPGEIVGQGVARFWLPGHEGAYLEALVATMERRPSFATETQLRALDGRALDVLFTVSLSPESRKRGVQLIGIVDIGDRVRAQEQVRRLQADFAHAARVSMLGELTASIAHEVNQPLAAIAASGEASLRWLARPEPDVGEVRELAARIVADAQRAAGIIGRVRAMAQRRAPEHAPLDLGEVIDETLLFLAHELAVHGVSVQLDLARGAPPALGDRTQLQQVLVNLAVNATQAMAEAGSPERRLAIRTRHAGDRLRLEVDDTGPGIAEDARARLFDSFFSTKAAGMGMGLPICRSILEAHGGTIAAEAAPGGGARFVVTLPAA